MRHITFSLICLAALGLAITISGEAQQADKSKAEPAVKQLSSDEFKALLEKGDKSLFFLDVREARELEEIGTVKGYYHIPLGELENRLSEVPKDKVIVTFCQRGGRAGRAGEILVKNGYKVAGACGVAPLKAENYPLIYPKLSEKK